MKTEQKEILELIRELLNEINSLELNERVEFINEVKLLLHEISPLKSEPVDCVLWVKCDDVYANDYNPNSVAPPEMELLKLSIEADGFTQPIVTMTDEENKREVIDGFHRNRVGKEFKEINDRLFGYLPVVSINEDRKNKEDRIAATIRHNRARGKHKISAMSDIVLDLKKRNWSNEKIGKNLGMDPDEVLRLTQIGGIAELFQDTEFSKSWEAEMIDLDDEIIEENID